MSQKLANATDAERVQYLESHVFNVNTVFGVEIRAAQETEWGDYVMVVDEETTWPEEDDRSLEQWARGAVKSEDEFFFEKVMYKHPTWNEETVCLRFTSLEDNVFRD